MRSCSVSFKELIRINRKEWQYQYLASKVSKIIFWTMYVYQFSSYCDAVRSLLVSFSVVSLMADARI